MEKLSNPQKTIEIIKKYEFAFQKKFGQNFLIDSHVLDKIIAAAGITGEDCVVEIGPGIGTLTQYLAETAREVIYVEINRMLIPILEETLAEYDNVTVINQDILKVDLEQLVAEHNGGRPVKIVANLPYYITTPLLFYFLDHREYWSEMVIMVQKEVAERVVASPGGKDYGVLTLMTAFDADAEILLHVPASAFEPRPSVDSAVLRLVRRDAPPFAVTDKKAFRSLVKAGFGQRRKTLSNALKNSGLFPEKTAASSLLEKCGIDGGRRGETLSFEEYAALANAFVSGE